MYVFALLLVFLTLSSFTNARRVYRGNVAPSQRNPSIVKDANDPANGYGIGGQTRKRVTGPKRRIWTDMETPGRPLLSVRDQGPTGTCYIHTALSLVEANHNLINKLVNNAEPEYLQRDTALHCMQEDLEEFGSYSNRESNRLTEVSVMMQCAGPVDTEESDGGDCGSTTKREQLSEKLNGDWAHGHEADFWIDIIEVHDDNTWEVATWLATPGKWVNLALPGYPSSGYDYEFVANALASHFAQTIKQQYGYDCTLQSSLPYTDLGDGGAAENVLMFLADQQSCVRHDFGHCWEDSEGHTVAYVPQPQSNPVTGEATAKFDASQCSHTRAFSTQTASGKSFSRFWNLQQGWEDGDFAPALSNEFKELRPYFVAYSPQLTPSLDETKKRAAIESIMAIVEHGVAAVSIYTCPGFGDYWYEDEHGAPLAFDDCDVEIDPAADNACDYGWHAVILLGYNFAGWDKPDENYFLIQNSWGLGWGVQGRARLKMGHFLLNEALIPLMRPANSLENPLIPKVNLDALHTLPPAAFTLHDNPLPTDAEGRALFPVFGPTDDSIAWAQLIVADNLPDVAIKTITLHLCATCAGTDQLTGAKLAVRSFSIDEAASFEDGMLVTLNPGQTKITLPVPPKAASRAASTHWTTLAVVLHGESTTSVAVEKIDFAIDRAQSAQFRGKEQLLPVSANSLMINALVVTLAFVLSLF